MADRSLDNLFELHPFLVRDCVAIGSLSACQLLLMNDSRYPWLILVPLRSGLRDLDELTPDESSLVWADMTLASRLLRNLYHPDKLNVAALGNVVDQLHIHVIARFQSDLSWPKPVWGQFSPLPYSADGLQETVGKIQQELGRIV